MINSEPIPLMTQTVANQSSLYNSYQNPNATTKLTLEQQYANLSNQMLQNQNQQPQFNPYDECLSLLNSCSEEMREKIYTDNRFISIDLQCEGLLKQSLYSKVLSEVLNTQQGRVAFEKRYLISKELKEEFSKDEFEMKKKLDVLLSDEVVLRRLQELQSAPQQSQASHPTQSPPQPQQPHQTAPQPSQSTPKQPNQQPPQRQNNYNKNNSQQKPQSTQSSGGVD